MQVMSEIARSDNTRALSSQLESARNQGKPNAWLNLRECFPAFVCGLKHQVIERLRRTNVFNFEKLRLLIGFEPQTSRVPDQALSQWCRAVGLRGAQPPQLCLYAVMKGHQCTLYLLYSLSEPPLVIYLALHHCLSPFRTQLQNPTRGASLTRLIYVDISNTLSVSSSINLRVASRTRSFATFFLPSDLLIDHDFTINDTKPRTCCD